MIKEKLGQHLDGWIHTAFPFLFKRTLDPDLLTLCGSLVSLVAAGAFAKGWFLAAGLLVLFGGFFDLVDGVVARHFGIATRFGAFLDSTMDRFVDMVLLLGIVLYYASSGALALAVLAGWALVVSILTSYSKARAELFIGELKVGFFERGERIGILALGALFEPFISVVDTVGIALGIVAVCGTITVVQRFAVARREMARMDLATTQPSEPSEE